MQGTWLVQSLYHGATTIGQLPAQSSISTAQLVLKCLSHSVCDVKNSVRGWLSLIPRPGYKARVDWKILSIRREPMLSGFSDFEHLLLHASHWKYMMFWGKVEESKMVGSCWESNPGHLACVTSALPLSYDNRTTSPHNPLHFSSISSYNITNFQCQARISKQLVWYTS